MTTMALAARSALARQLQLARRGRTWIQVLSGRHARVDAWQHYPRHDAVDAAGRWQFYFHAHAAVAPDHAPLRKELGHVHLFRRSPAGQLTHLCALVLDARGMPLGWTANNQWVTGGRWYAAATLVRWLSCFELRLHGPLAGLALWLCDLVALYRQPLAQMLHQRDARLAQHRSRQGLTQAQALADRSVSVWQSFSIRWPADALAAAS